MQIPQPVQDATAHVRRKWQDLTVEQVVGGVKRHGKSVLKVSPYLIGGFWWMATTLDTQAQEYINEVMKAPMAAQAKELGAVSQELEKLTAIVGELAKNAETEGEQTIAVDKLNRVACILEAQARGEDILLRCGE